MLSEACWALVKLLFLFYFFLSFTELKLRICNWYCTTLFITIYHQLSIRYFTSYGKRELFSKYFKSIVWHLVINVTQPPFVCSKLVTNQDNRTMSVDIVLVLLLIEQISCLQAFYLLWTNKCWLCLIMYWFIRCRNYGIHRKNCF